MAPASVVPKTGSAAEPPVAATAKDASPPASFGVALDDAMRAVPSNGAESPAAPPQPPDAMAPPSVLVAKSAPLAMVLAPPSMRGDAPSAAVKSGGPRKNLPGGMEPDSPSQPATTAAAPPLPQVADPAMPPPALPPSPPPDGTADPAPMADAGVHLRGGRVTRAGAQSSDDPAVPRDGVPRDGAALVPPPPGASEVSLTTASISAGAASAIAGSSPAIAAPQPNLPATGKAASGSAATSAEGRAELTYQPAAYPGAPERLTLKLTPAELGAVTFEIRTPTEGPRQVHVLIDRPETLALFQQDHQHLATALARAGLDADATQVTVSLARNAAPHPSPDPSPATTAPPSQFSAGSFTSGQGSARDDRPASAGFGPPLGEEPDTGPVAGEPPPPRPRLAYAVLDIFA
ncbi:MAG: flagellar hook-length control protein FliK [Alphaproteobacteria bacterium]|nr:flagellar hook-length control protein FliK [Alphaproteobacteria bacterium]